MAVKITSMHVGAHLLASGVVFGAAALVGDKPTLSLMLGVLGGGVMVDIDHLVFSILKIRPLTLSEIWNVNKELFIKMEPRFYIFHTFEMFLLLSLLSMQFNWGRYFVLSYGVHLLMDIFKYATKKKSLDFLPLWCGSYYLLKEKNGRG